MELSLYYRVTQPDRYAKERERERRKPQRIHGGLLDGPSEVRDREYTQRLLEKVAEAQRAARARAERFNEEYKEPKLSVILSREEFRKYMSATGGRNPLMLETAPVAGIDTTSTEEQARIAARGNRFAAATGIKEGDAEAAAAVAASAAAAAELQEREAEFAREQAAMEARAAKFGLEINTNPYGEDLQQPTCARREIPTAEQLAEMAAAAAAEDPPGQVPNVDVIVDTLHVFGVDRLSTDEILKYFDDYAPSYVLWLDDSSCNLVFGDAANARRALFSLGQPIRVTAVTEAAPEGEIGEGNAPAAVTAHTDPVWRRGPNYSKKGFEYAVLMRQAVSTDAKKGKPAKSKRLWLDDQRGRRGRAGAGSGGTDYNGDYRGGRMAPSKARPGHVPKQSKSALPVHPSWDPTMMPDGTPLVAQGDAPLQQFLDLRATLGGVGKAKKERRGRKQRHNPYGMQIDADEGEVTMMDADEAQRIMDTAPAAQAAPSTALTAQEAMMLEGATAAADTMAE